MLRKSLPALVLWLLAAALPAVALLANLSGARFAEGEAQKLAELFRN